MDNLSDPGLEDRSGDAGRVEYSDLSDELSLRHSRVQLTGERVIQKQAAPVCVECLGGGLDDGPEDFAEVLESGNFL